MEELVYSNIEDIKIETKLVKNVNFKPKTAPIICLVAGVGIMFVSGVFAKILGVFFIVMGAAVLKFVPDRKIIDIYQDGALIYRASDQKMGFFLKYDDIKMWKASREEGHDCIIFVLNSGYKLSVETFELNKAFEALMKVAGSKEERAIQHEKNKKMKWANPIDTIRNLINRKKK